MTRRARARRCAPTCEVADAPHLASLTNPVIWIDGPERADGARMNTQTEETKKLDDRAVPRQQVPEPRDSDLIDDLEPYNLPFTD